MFKKVFSWKIFQKSANPSIRKFIKIWILLFYFLWDMPLFCFSSQMIRPHHPYPMDPYNAHAMGPFSMHSPFPGKYQLTKKTFFFKKSGKENWPISIYSVWSQNVTNIPVPLKVRITETNFSVSKIKYLNDLKHVSIWNLALTRHLVIFRKILGFRRFLYPITMNPNQLIKNKTGIGFLV